MGFRYWLHADNLSEELWKLRCKIFPPDSKAKGSFEPKDFSLTSGDVDGADISNQSNEGKHGSTKTSKSTNPAKALNGKDPTFGQELTIKYFFESKKSRDERYDWVDYPPKQISKSAALAQDRTAIRVYKVKDHDKPSLNGRFSLRFHMISVQNPSIVATIAPILKEKENVDLDLNDTATFHWPFRDLWFCWDDIGAAWLKAKEEGDEEGKKVQLLLEVLSSAFDDLKVKWKHMKSSGLVTFHGAWTLFPRGCTVYSYGMNSETITKVESTRIVKTNAALLLFINAKSLIFNGEDFVWEDEFLVIEEFTGNKPIAELDHYPLEFHPEGDRILKTLLARGKKVLDLQGLHYSCYDGIALHKPDEKTTEKHNVEGRVLIDVVGYNKYHLSKGSRENKDPITDRNRAMRPYPPLPGGRPKPPPYPPPSKRSKRRVLDHPGAHPHPRAYNDGTDSSDEDDDDDDKPTSKSMRLSVEQQEKNKLQMLENENDLAFLSNMIGGYALKNKLWVQFYVEDTRPMVWNDRAFEHLVYDDQQKDLVLSFVESHKRTNAPSTKAKNKGKNDSEVEDVIRGKGQGLIMLLSGPPGTGKTLTAEAVADRTQRPLFYLQAEDLGINASVLGANVKRVFEMATDWDAVILLDEADVFMAERHPNDIHRNELVSIFLRELEYFRGIIFLTTNLYSTIDTAFRSRVSLHLLFRALDRTARETVWLKFLDGIPKKREIQEFADVNEDGGEEFTDENQNTVGRATAKGTNQAKLVLDADDIKELSLWSLNGREIKNAVKMVKNWCDHKNYIMNLERIESGIKVTSPLASKEGDHNDELYDD